MGMFGKKKEEPQRIDYKKIGDIEVPEEERLAIAGEALRIIGEGLTGPMVARKYDELELRGKLAGLPVQITLPQIGWIKIEMIVDGRWPFYNLEYNLDRTPAKDKLLDPLWDDMDERGVFLAPGVFFKGADADRVAASFLKLPAEFVQRAISTMVAENIHFLELQPRKFFLQFHEYTSDMDDLFRSMRNGLALLREAADVLGSAAPEARHLAKPAMPAPLRCRYCRGWFFPVNRDLHCVNCGAPYDSEESPG